MTCDKFKREVMEDVVQINATKLFRYESEALTNSII